jgi:hypothetical protein
MATARLISRLHFLLGGSNQFRNGAILADDVSDHLETLSLQGNLADRHVPAVLTHSGRALYLWRNEVGRMSYTPLQNSFSADNRGKEAKCAY